MSYHLPAHHTTKPHPSAFSHWRARLAAGIALATLLTCSGFGAAQALDNPTVPSQPMLLITQVQTRGCTASTTACTEDDSKEYVQIYNPSAANLQVSGWKLRYYNSSGTASDLATFSGTFASHSYSLLAHAGTYDDLADITFATGSTANKLYKTVGHVAIIDSSENTVDLVGWGAGAAKALGTPAVAPELGKILERKSEAATGSLVYTGNNSNDFASVAAKQPESGGFALPTPAPAEEIPTNPTSPTTTCEGIVITELLPNPAGADTGHEFVELYNPTNEAIPLQSCSLQSSASSTKTFSFPQIILQPDEYKSFDDTTTGITLPNSAGGTAWLLSPTDELQAISYPANLEDDQAWALNNGAWAATYTPTPGAANTATPLRPCEDPAQIRSAETGRCATPEVVASTSGSAASTSGLTACKAGQERNPETNRCRAVAVASSTAAACKEGQERNPETNRCRAVASGTTTKDCPAGQERNPETNRCRKILASGASSTITDVKDASSASSASHGKPYWLIGIAAGILIVGYAVYEWRQEIRQFAAKHLPKIPFNKQMSKLSTVN